MPTGTWIAFLGILLSLAYAADGYADEAKPNCLIRITHTAANGQKDRIQFGTHLNTKEECRALARIHERATPPPTAVSKKVVFKWKVRGRVAMR